MTLMRTACLTLLLTTAAFAGEAGLQPLLDRVTRLDDRDPHVREAARIALMGLTADDLPDLRKAVIAAGPVRPQRAEALRQVVTYVLARQTVRRLPWQSSGFLGVRVEAGVFFNAEESENTGASITSIVPGFVAGRYLAVGDQLMSVTANGQTDWVGRGRTVTDIVGKYLAGQSVELLVNRSGRPMTFTIVLDGRPDSGRPDDPDRGAWEYLTTDQAELNAEAEFVKQFGDLVGES